MENEPHHPTPPQPSLNIQLTIPGGRSFSPAVFGLAILFFFFTFCEFKCGGETIGAIQGIQLVTGGEILGEDASPGEGREFPANIWAIIAFSCAIASLAFYLAKAKMAGTVGIAAGAVGALSMLLLQASLNENVTKEAEGVVQIVYKFPFWGALVSLILGAAGSYLTRTPMPIPAASPEMPPENPPPLSGPAPPGPDNTSRMQLPDISQFVQKNKKSLLLAFSLLGLVVVTVFTLKSTVMSPTFKAKRLLKTEKYYEAAPILLSEIQHNPQRYKLHVLYGQSLLGQNDFYSALNSFNQAVNLHARAGKRIGSILLEEAKKAFLNNDYEKANSCIQSCLSYDKKNEKKVVSLIESSLAEVLQAENLAAAYSLAQTAKGIDEQSAKALSKKALEIAGELEKTHEKSTQMMGLANFSASIDPQMQSEWVPILKEHLQATQQSIDPNVCIDLCIKVAQWDPASGPQIADILLKKAEHELYKDTINTGAISLLFESAGNLNESYRSKAVFLIWEKISGRMADLKSFGLLPFLNHMGVLKSFPIPAEISQTRRFKLAEGLENFSKGNREQAFLTFDELSKEPNTEEGKIAARILSPPPPSKIDFNFEPFHFKGTWKAWGYRPGGIIIDLLSASVHNSSIVLTFSMKATPEEKDCLIFAHINKNERFGGHCEMLYLLDDNGKKLYTTSGFFTNGEIKRFNSCTNQICFNPGQELLVSAEFPMISPGATSAKFVSPDPDHGGHQYDWYWDGIVFKKGPFE